MTGPISDHKSVFRGDPGTAPSRSHAAVWRNLADATLGFTLTFRAWNLVAQGGGVRARHRGRSARR
ncbi:hypothetical protein [Streptomyces spinosirectus]